MRSRKMLYGTFLTNCGVPYFQRQSVACPEGLEPPTYCLEGNCSIRLSYGQMRARCRKTLTQEAPKGPNDNRVAAGGATVAHI